MAVIRVTQFWDEEYVPMYTTVTGVTRGTRDLCADVPEDVWARYRKAEDALEEARAEIVEYFK